MDATPRTKLVLVRHGQTDSNAAGRFQGQQDVPLNRIGRSQADALAERLVRLKAARIVTSDLLRARATADAIATASGVGVSVDERLREIDVGSWQGRTSVEVAAENPWFEEELHSGRDFRRSETGETAAEAGERVAAVLHELAEAHPRETTFVVGHGLALRVGLCLFLGLGLDASFAISGLWNCSWTILDHNERWRLQSYNNVVVGHSGPLASPSSR
ncbi:histidine phosphatase family protein [Propioniciclava sinopodophylli]|uniref:histidine phosphatase family protein n=1 Tax=Propioniciclava sinopodophylli TaxID=1837344 RepID=UPI002490383C|nr:histidine phosphatase family protein [Propioniciclava sinopodophylli]